jgi:hypothetical protein
MLFYRGNGEHEMVVANMQLARLLAELHHGFARPWKRTLRETKFVSIKNGKTTPWGEIEGHILI